MPMPDLDESELVRFKGQLEAERLEIAAMSAGAADERRPVALDQQSVGRLSRMDAMQVQAMAIASEERRQARLRRIEAALRRISEGEYGFCAGCDEPIPVKRLEIDPTVTRCIRCAQAPD
jgi:DnaK suppressor protein